VNRPRWRKLGGDLRANRGRVILMTAAIAAGGFGLGTMLTAYAILTREITRNYAATEPASATIELEAVDADLVAAVRRQPGIADAEARGTLVARVRVGADWTPLLLFVIDDFDAIRLNRFKSESGAWPPPAGSILLERSGLAMLGTAQNGTLQIKTPHGGERRVVVSGITHDPGLAPAWQERTGYGYITRETLAALGEPPVLDELRVRVAERPGDRGAIEATTRALAAWLQARGREVREIQIPPPARHPHQGQMEGVLALFIVFSALALLLAGILAANVIAGLLAAQVREIGVMKAIGGRTCQIAGLYFVLVIGAGLVALAAALPAGLVAGMKFADVIAAMLNFDLATHRVPGWVFAVEVAATVLVPLGCAATPVLGACRATVHAAINDYGVKADAFGRGRMERLLSTGRNRNRLAVMALRNVFRRRGRLWLSLGLLAAAGGMFMAALNLEEAWRRMVARVYTDRRYDVEIRLHAPEREAALRAALRDVPGLRLLEMWDFSTTAVAKPDQVDVVQTYPDGGHGSFVLLGTVPETAAVKFPLLAGRWLRPGDTHAVVLNQRARAMTAPAKARAAIFGRAVPGRLAAGVATSNQVGDRVSLSIGGQFATWVVVGVVEEVGSPAAAYVTRETYAQAVGEGGRAQMLRIASSAVDPEARLEAIRKIEAALARAGIGVRVGLPLAELRTAMGDHVVVLQRTLVATAGLLGVIGLLGLTSNLTMNVIERTRELGVMKAVGARPRTLLWLIVIEGQWIALLSCVWAVPVAAGLSWLLGRIVGAMAFGLPLPPAFSPWVAVLWVVALCGLALLAGALPARRAARITVREALAYG